MPNTWQRLTPIVAIAVLAAACSSTPSSPVPSPTASPALTIPTAAPSLTVTPQPTAASSATPAPTPSAIAATWSTPTVISKGGCDELTATVDPAGRYHAAAVCNEAMRYMTSADGIDWVETTSTPPLHRLERDPQLALDGDRLYLAYSLLAPREGACGSNALTDVGVYTRWIQPPNGKWSDPVRIGAIGDHVESFRVADGVQHLIVAAGEDDGPMSYESQAGSTFTKVAVPGAVTTSLRVGDDGHARIAYVTGHALRYARVSGTQLSITTVAAKTSTFLRWPSLVLGPGDHAYLVWSQDTDNGGGCASPDPGPIDGVYFATDASGQWKTTRLTKLPARPSLTLDPSTGRLEVVLNDEHGLTQYESIGGADWTSTTIPEPIPLDAPLVRVNPATGSLNVLALDYDTGIYLTTKP